MSRRRYKSSKNPEYKDRSAMESPSYLDPEYFEAAHARYMRGAEEYALQDPDEPPAEPADPAPEPIPAPLPEPSPAPIPEPPAQFKQHLTPIFVLTAIFGALFIILPLLVRKGPNKGIVQCSLMLTVACMYIFWVTVDR
ncbi:unnamed protein product [Leptidea sinapis]|uniref:Uncharacterized protein n=1 Tax=Leptidea sinapis TaxID=189913 RepID=A0A5E4R552_9NEOP|nr:unnamed protein product [Leptidea sinapis]